MSSELRSSIISVTSDKIESKFLDLYVLVSKDEKSFSSVLNTLTSIFKSKHYDYLRTLSISNARF